MWDSNYASEPMDLKLLAIRWKNKIWIPLIAALIGAAIGGIIYMIQHVMLEPQERYEAYSELYVDFLADESGKYIYYSFNEAGWNSLVKTDAVLEAAQTQIPFAITKEELREAVSANNQSDHRMIQMTVTYPNPEQAVTIANAMERSLLVFAEQMRECESIRLFTSAESAKRIIADNFTARAALLGGLLALLATIAVQWIYAVLDDSIYVPLTFEKRYGIPMLGVMTKQKNEKYIQELISAKNTICTKQGGYTVVGVDENQPLDTVCELLRESSDLEEMNKNNTKNVILVVLAGDRNGKRIEEKISNLKKRGCCIAAAVLTEVEDSLLKEYYFGKRRKKA